MIFFRTLVAIFAVIMIVVGLATAVTPIPFGLPLVILGFFLFASAAPAVLRKLRRRWRWLDRRLRWLERKLPRWMTRALRDTDPDAQDDAQDDAQHEEPSDERDVARAAQPARRGARRR